MAGDDCCRTVRDSLKYSGLQFYFISSDCIAEGIRARLNLSAEELTLAQILESATWKGGREIARQRRPDTGGPPIEIESDGTVM
jgi:hypothetical protein